MFLVIQIDKIIATLYRSGWDIFPGGTITDGQAENLKNFLELIMKEDLPGYAPNYYYSKGKQIEFAINGAKMLYYLMQNEGEGKAPANTVY